MVDEQKEKKSSPHPEYSKNNDYYGLMMSKVSFSEEVSIEVQETVTEKLCVLFVHGPIGARKGAYHLSFHEGHPTFRINLCNIFNEMHRKGLLVKNEEDKIQKEINKIWKQYDYTD